MSYFMVAALMVLAAFFVAASLYYKKRGKGLKKDSEKPAFRTEDSLQEYGKPMKDGRGEPGVSFDDAE
jgi:hypothetical protein